MRLEWNAELRLATRARDINNQIARDSHSSRSSLIAGNKRQREIDAGTYPGRGPDILIFDIDRVQFHMGFWVTALQLLGPSPVRSHPPP
ncbi:hypothetical protein NS226_23045 [Aureimonas ureilytica]|uniref:Uncharacterized protein n=1 Tax=Aureimonas ureilytica TaxID=401562 RepID=A0A175QU33_9HYPH|nr:hypothetical protein NS226_23045 [Aureimonas ureilytica]